MLEHLLDIDKIIMKLYSCCNCDNPLYFENSACLNCQHAVGFEALRFELITLDLHSNVYSPVDRKDEAYRYCSNAALGTCNWLIPIDHNSMFCKACELNRTIPALTSSENREKWKRIEIAKHRLIYSLLRLNLSVAAKRFPEDPVGIAFDFIADTSPSVRVMTGHDNGVITLNIEEADEGQLIRHKLDLGENTARYWDISATK